MYTCVCMYMYLCAYNCLYVTYIWKKKCLDPRVYMSVYIYMRVSKYMHMCVYIYICV